MAGCAPAFTANPELQEKIASIKTVAIMPPSVTVYQLALGGATQVMEKETAAARPILAMAIERELGRHAGVVFTPFPTPSASLDSSRDSAAARLTTELENTQDVERLAKLTKADALLFTTGVDHISTGGRKAALIGGALALCLMTVPIGGGGCYALNTDLIAPPGTTFLSVALVDATTGTLLWHNAAGFQGGVYSLTNTNSAADLATRVFEDFPLGMRPTRKESDRNAWPTGLGPR